MNKCCITLLAFLICLIGYSQTNLEKEKQASDYFEKGLSLRHAQKDSSYYYLNLAAVYSVELGNYSGALDILLESIFASGIHYDLKKYRLYLDKAQNVLETNKTEMSAKDTVFYRNRLIYEEGSYLVELKKLTEAKSQFQRLYDIYSKKKVETLDYDDLSFLIYSTNVLASIYMDLGKYDLAETYFNRSLLVVESNELAKEEGFDRSTNRLLAQLYINMGKYKSAEVILQQLLFPYKKLYTSDKEYKNSLVVVYQRMVDNYIQQDSLQKALFYLDESQEYLLDEDPFYKQSLLLYGDIHLMQNKNEQAFRYFQNALEFFKKYRQNKPHQDVAKVYGKIAELHLKQKKYQEGLETIQKAFNVAGRKIQITNFKQNPNPNKAFSKTQLLHLLDVKLQLLQGAYEYSEEADYQASILQTSNDILKTFDPLKSEFDSKIDKQFLAEKAYPVFHRMMEAVHEIYKKDRSPETLQLALNIAEKNKDFVLLEALRSAQATRYGDVPAKVLEKEAQLRAEITNLEKQLFDATETDSGFSESIFKRKQEYFDFLDTIKSQYPKYHRLKYQNRTLNLATVRKKLLGNNGTLISYTMADNYLYAIIINDSNEDFLKLPFNETDREAIKTFYRLLSSASINGVEAKIYDLANSLFEKILQEPLANYDTENLTIIPDGELHYLPFDLLQEKGSYLLETKSIGYGNSVASLLALKEKPSSETNSVLAFAPSFSGTVAESLDRQFGKLLYNDDEVEKLGTFFDSETLLKGEATLSNFKTNSSRFNIFHLATHASANDEYPDYSYLAFTETKDSTQGDILYIKDLYNMTLPADMVTLSACQTGIGKLQKGQGMMSLSKGFYYAGAKSLVTTLWKINDKSTVKLMEYFYEELSKGKSKTEALRQAKLKYLASTDDELLKHPYYWAAFVVSGDVSPISNSNALWWFVGVGVFLLLVFLIFSKKGKDFGKTKLQN